MTDKPMTVGEWIDLRICHLKHSLEILAQNGGDYPDIEECAYKKGREEQINDEIDFLGTFQILHKYALSNPLIT
jgi:hypothetical protein